MENNMWKKLDKWFKHNWIWTTTWFLLIVTVTTSIYVKTNDMGWVMTGLLLAVVVPVVIFWTLREILIVMARSNFLVTTVKKGKIKLTKLNGRVLNYISNLFDVEYVEYFDGTHEAETDTKVFTKEYLEAVKKGLTWNYRRFVEIPDPSDPKGKKKIVKVRGLEVTRVGKTVDKLTGEMMGRGKPSEKSLEFPSPNNFPLSARVKNGVYDDENRTWLEKSILWDRFGVNWTGFGGSVYEYLFEKTYMNLDEELITTTELASSLYNENVFYVKLVASETLGMTPLTVKAQVVTVTTHAGRSLNVDNWVRFTQVQIQSAIRDYVSKFGARTVTRQQCEEGGKMWIAVMMLNEGVRGNPSLPDRVGQAIVSFSVNTLEMDDEEMEKALQAKALAEERAKGVIAIAEGEAEAIRIKAEATAKATTAIGEAKNKVLDETVKKIGTKGAELLRRTEAAAQGIADFQGKALSLGGGGGIPFILSDESGKEKE